MNWISLCSRLNSPLCPPACPVIPDACCYRARQNDINMPPACPVVLTFVATERARTISTCHRLARWSLTLVATDRTESLSSRHGPCSSEHEAPPGKPVVSTNLIVAARVAANMNLHRASRWHRSIQIRRSNCSLRKRFRDSLQKKPLCRRLGSCDK